MPIHFMLAHDAQSGATIREQFAQLNATNVKVGTFDVLLDLLLEYWLIPFSDDDSWSTKLSHSALSMSDAFWAKSIKTDEKSVIDELDTSLQVLLNALPLSSSSLAVIDGSTTRYTRYYSDLRSLHEQMDEMFPSSIEKARRWNVSSELAPLEEIVVYMDDALGLDTWQKEIIAKLQSSGRSDYMKLYTESLIPKLDSSYEDVKHLQTMLFSSEAVKSIPERKNLQWLVARDVQQEVEVLAGMIQNVYSTGTSFDEMAVVIPRDGWYKDFLIQTFESFNIPLSRAGQVEEYADLGTQWIFDAIQAQDMFAAPMVFASLFSSPLMPYPYSKGQHLASIALGNAWRNDKGELKCDLFDTLSEEAQALIQAVIAWQEKDSVKTITDFLDEVGELHSLISSPESIRLHKKRFKSLVSDLHAYCEKFPDTTYKTLINQVQPYALQENSQREAFLNSVHVVYEDDYMIEEVKHLFVLGFNNGHYPRQLENVGVFSRMNWQSLAVDLNLALAPQEQFYEKAKTTFKRQLQCANENITFLSSALDLQGGRLTPSSSLSDMAFCFHDGKGELEPEELLILLEEEKEKPFFYATSIAQKTKAHRELSSCDIKFEQNIFELRTKADGTLRPESPSSFEKLMISPFGWFIYRQGLEAKTWGVEELDVATQGTIAHGVFEDMFCPTNPSHDLSAIHTSIEKRIKEEAPFLEQDHKRLDYEQLKTSILKSADEFKALLLHSGGSVKSTEEKLHGEIFGIPVAGRTDAILEMLGKQLVVDYKKSGAKKRVERMRAGFDHQLFLYRIMLNDDKALTAYYTMNDATLVVDEEIALVGTDVFNIIGIEEDCTINASTLMQERIEELSKGEIKLNSTDDNKLWDQRGVTASYSLESSPLIQLFMKEIVEDSNEN